MIDYSSNNIVTLVGTIVSERTFSHEVYGEIFYSFNIEVPRVSEYTDIIPLTVSERILSDELQIGEKVVIDGQFRSYNNYESEKNKLVLTVFVKDIKILTEDMEIVKENEVSLTGFICKTPIYRTTPLGKEIFDILLAVNRAYNKSDYIPCIAFDRYAKYCKNIEAGERVKLSGRFRSRPYQKKLEDGTFETKTAYEVYIYKLESVEKPRFS